MANKISQQKGTTPLDVVLLIEWTVKT